MKMFTEKKNLRTKYLQAKWKQVIASLTFLRLKVEFLIKTSKVSFMNLKTLPASVNYTCYLKFIKSRLMFLEDQSYQILGQLKKK